MVNRKWPFSSHIEQNTMKRRAVDSDVLDLSKKSSGPSDVSAHGAIDLSRKEDQPPKDTDVICLSDDDEEELARLEQALTSDDSKTNGDDRRKFLKKLANDLRNEEARLLLLRKMRASQAPLSAQRQPQNSQMRPGQLPSATQQGGSARSSIPSQSPSRPSIPPRPSPIPSHPTPAHSRDSTQASPQSTPSTQQQHSRTPTTTPNTATTPQTPSTPTVRVTKQMAIQVLDQRRQSRKTVLRKETERSLLEITSPCPSQTELSFIPSIATNEFVALVGMEEVVKSIQENDRILRGGKVKEVSYTITPFTCIQCGSDFTPLWKRDKSGGCNVICETCLSTSQRESVQNDYMDKIKTVLKKAQAQEKQIDKDYKDVVNNPTELAKFQREQERHLQAQQPPPPTRPSQQASIPVNRAQSGTNSMASSHHSMRLQGGSMTNLTQSTNMRNQPVSRHSTGSSQPPHKSSLGISSGSQVRSSVTGTSPSRSSTASGSTAAQVSSSASTQQAAAARNAAALAAQAQALMSLPNLFQGAGGGVSNDYRQQFLQQALLQQFSLLQAQPQYLPTGNSSYLTMLQNWGQAAAAANNSNNTNPKNNGKK